MTTTTLTSELEAINTMLDACDEAPVQSLAVTGLFPLDKAKGILSETARVVQSIGWNFNTEEGLTLPLAGDNTLTLPANTIRFDPVRSTSRDLRQRGLRMYDVKGHTYVLASAVEGTIVYLLGWDDLPQAARHYITIRASRTMQGRSSVSDGVYKYTQEDQDAARMALEEDQSDVVNANFLRDSWSVSSVLQSKGDLWA